MVKDESGGRLVRIVEDLENLVHLRNKEEGLNQHREARAN